MAHMDEQRLMTRVARISVSVPNGVYSELVGTGIALLSLIPLAFIGREKSA